jgi:MATE family multidrug resistance protein
LNTHPSRPAETLDDAGLPHIDNRAILLLAGPLMANNAIQAVLNLTDTWFVSQLSTTATAAMSAIYWVVLCATMLLGGVAMAVQTFAAQAFGAGRHADASAAAWSGVAASVLTIPVFAVIALLGPPLLAALHLDPDVTRLALDYWWPRLLVGGPVGLIAWSLTGFFNGIGRVRLTLAVTLLMALANIPLNHWFIFSFGLGVGGSAWATVVAQLLGILLSLGFFLGPALGKQYATWSSFRHLSIRRQFALGLPMGLGITADILGLALFQLMLVSESAMAGAATQIVMMLTSLAYMPGIGIALAGTTLVGQSIGAGDLDWARHLGNRIIALTTGLMGLIGIVLALGSPWLLPLFVNPADHQALAVLALAKPLIWLAACYQVFDGLNLGASFCLRGAGDARVPAIIIALLSWGIWVPATHMLTFTEGQGWVGFLPAFGFGAIGGWSASVVYVIALGSAMGLRWRSGAWRTLALGARRDPPGEGGAS